MPEEPVQSAQPDSTSHSSERGKTRVARRSSTKSNGAEIALRVEQVIQWVIDGEPRRKIVQLGSKKWNITPRQIDDYLAAAKKQIAESAKTNLEQQRGIFLSRCNDIYRAHRKRAPHAALKAVELAADLQGMLTKGAQINLTATATSGAGLSPESIAEVQRVVAEATKTALDEQAKKGGSDAAQS